jgi:hypothetical protein
VNNILVNGVWKSINDATPQELLLALLPSIADAEGKVFKVVNGVPCFVSAGGGGYDGDPTVIQQSATYRLVSDAEKTTWNGKAAGYLW